MDTNGNTKKLLIKDLCSRLPYGVKAYVKNWSKLERKWIEDIYTVKSLYPSPLSTIFVSSELGSVEVILGYDDYEIKPYLFPLSSMTEEQKEEFNSYVLFDGIQLSWESFDGVMLSDIEALIDFFHKNHIDYRGLIEKSLALDATGLNIY